MSGNHVAKSTHKATSYNQKPKTDDPSLKSKQLWKPEASKDPLQIAHFMAHVYEITEALRKGKSNDNCSWLLHALYCPLCLCHLS